MEQATDSLHVTDTNIKAHANVFQGQGGAADEILGATDMVKRDVRAAFLLAIMRRVFLRRARLALSVWKTCCKKDASAAIAAERQQFTRFQVMMESRSKRICIRYGLDKLHAIVKLRQSHSARVAFEKWKATAIVDHARSILARSRLQVQVALDQARAERGVYERAELQAAKDKHMVMIKYAFMRWQEVKRLQQLERSVALLAARLEAVPTARTPTSKNLGSTTSADEFLAEISRLLST